MLVFGIIIVFMFLNFFVFVVEFIVDFEYSFV
jgi:hypothetical protein